MSIEAIGSQTSVWASAMQALKSRQEEPDESMLDDTASQVLSDNDQDGDDLLSIEEMDLSEDEFAELDTDGDGQVSTAEIAEGLTNHVESLHDLVNPAAQFAQHMLAEFDADDDDSLSLEESGLDETDFSELDTDGDGLLSADEIEAGAPPPPPTSSEAGASGEDSDEEAKDSVSLAGTPAASYIDEMDTNEDGVVSQAELLAWMEKSQTSLAEILSEDDSSEDESGVAGLFSSALKAYQNQLDTLMEDLYGTDASFQSLLEAGLSSSTLDLSV